MFHLDVVSVPHADAVFLRPRHLAVRLVCILIDNVHCAAFFGSFYLLIIALCHIVMLLSYRLVVTSCHVNAHWYVNVKHKKRL